MHRASLDLGGRDYAGGVRSCTQDRGCVTVTVSPNDGGNVVASAVGGALKGVLREDNRSHFVGLTAGKDYGKSVERGLRVRDVGGVEGRGVAQLNVVFITLEDEGHNDGVRVATLHRAMETSAEVLPDPCPTVFMRSL